MAAITWAQTVRCDYPECLSIAEVTMGEKQMMRILPPGWLDLSGNGVILRDAFGAELRELCSIHALFSLEQVVAALKLEKRN